MKGTKGKTYEEFDSNVIVDVDPVKLSPLTANQILTFVFVPPCVFSICNENPNSY